MENNDKKYQCSGNCLNCSPAQRAYCASQHAYSNMRVLDALMKEVRELRERIDAMQRGEEAVFEPMAHAVGEVTARVREEKPVGEAPGTVATVAVGLHG